MLLDGQADMEVVGNASSVDEARELPAGIRPDVALLDFHLGDGTGRDAARAMRAIFPDVKFIFLSRDGTDDTRLAAVEAGASAFVHKSSPASELIAAIHAVASGASLITPATIAVLVTAGKDHARIRESLSPREHEVLQLLSDGVPTRTIAARLGISYSTMRTHIRAISTKLGARSMVNAVVTARELELVT